MKILVVDDNQPNRYLLESLLSAHGHHVDTATNGVEALEKLAGNDVDLIISDILMPGMDGFELCRQVRTSERWHNLPFVFYTATYTDAKDEELALNLGADKFIVKPQEPAAFVSAINDVVENIRATRPAPPQSAFVTESSYLKQYNERLVRKLEDKMLQLEQTNKNLEETAAQLRQSVEQLRALASRVVAAREQEARRIAGALHDEASQLLIGVHLGLGQLLNRAPQEDQPPIRQLIEYLSRAEAQLRDISHELHPAVIEELGLLPALRTLADGFKARHGIAISLESSAPGRFSPEVATAIYRIVQEALNNVAKHAGARSAAVRIFETEAVIGCSVKDDGAGFNADQVSRRTGGLGLIGIRERLQELGGSLRIDSTPGGGTELTASIPRFRAR